MLIIWVVIIVMVLCNVRRIGLGEKIFNCFDFCSEIVI